MYGPDGSSAGYAGKGRKEFTGRGSSCHLPGVAEQNQLNLTTATLFPCLSPSPDSYLLLGRLETHPVHLGVLRAEDLTLGRRSVHPCGTKETGNGWTPCHNDEPSDRTMSRLKHVRLWRVGHKCHGSPS